MSIPLIDCAKTFNYPYQPHDSAEDARATLHCFNAILSDPDCQAIMYQKVKKIRHYPWLMILGTLSFAVGESLIYENMSSYVTSLRGFSTYISQTIAELPNSGQQLIALSLIVLGLLLIAIGVIRGVVRLIRRFLPV